jgi:hypothetical protein
MIPSQLTIGVNASFYLLEGDRQIPQNDFAESDHLRQSWPDRSNGESSGRQSER